MSEPGWTRFQRATFGLCFTIWGVGLWLWISSATSWELRPQLMVLSPAFLSVTALALLAALGFSGPLIRRLVGSLRLRRIVGPVAAVVLAFALVHAVSPRTHRIYYDEDIYEDIGLEIAHNNKAAMVNDGTWQYGHFEGRRLEYNKQPNGWPFLLSLAFRLAGPSERTAFTLANLMFPLSVGLLFACAVLLLDSPVIGLGAALIYALIPENVLWFSTVAVEPATACLSLCAIASALLFCRTRATSALVLTAAALAWSLQFRSETLLLVLWVLALFLLECPEELPRPRMLWCGLCFLVLISAHLVHLYAFRADPWGSRGVRFSWDFFFHNIDANTVYYLDGRRFPVLFSALAFLGLIFSRGWKRRILVATWFLLTWGPFLFFYAGSYGYGADVRYALMSMPPLALLAGMGLERGVVFLQRWMPRGRAAWAAGLLAVATALYYLPLMRAAGQEAWECRDDHLWAEHFATLVPEDGIILTHNPNMFHLMGKSAAQMSLFSEQPQYVQNELTPQYRDKMYLHWNYWCNLNVPVQSAFIQRILDTYRTTLLEEEWVRGRRYALFKIGERLNQPAPAGSLEHPTQ